MNDSELIEAFEGLALPPGSFGHTDHVRLAFAYLSRYDLWDALDRSRRGLKAFATHAGAPGKYHETITCGLVFLIHQRMTARPELVTWVDFAEANPDLLEWKDGAFFRYYPPEVVDSDLARRTFVLPHPAPAAVAP